MNAKILEITARIKINLMWVADVNDFEYEEGAEIEPEVILKNPLISLYCLDHANRCALFVETASGHDLSQAPFFYVAQYEAAVRLISVPYETLYRLSDQVSLDSQQVIFLYSTGRTGSTLLGAALNAAEGIVGLSEPDVFTQLVTLREWDGSNEAEIKALARSCVKCLCKPTEQIPHPVGWVIKFRSFGVELGDLLWNDFPNAKNIFLYRHAETWLNSAKRTFAQAVTSPEHRAGIQQWLPTVHRSIFHLMEANDAELTLGEMVAMMWLATLDCYMRLHNMGMEGIVFRYEDIRATPHQVLQNLFEYIGLSTANMDVVYRVLEKDSQAGSVLARDVVGHKKDVLTDNDLAELKAVLQAHPVIQAPDFVVPTTWIPPV